MSRPAEAPSLVHRALDGWLVGGLAVLVWCAAFALSDKDIHVPTALVSVVYWAGAAITAAHFGLSYHLAYRSGAPALRERPFVLLAAPAVLALALLALVVAALRSGDAAVGKVIAAMITFVYLATTWHYVKQVYGVGRVAAAYARTTLDTLDVRVLRYGLYPLWFVGAAQLLVNGHSYSLAGYRVGYELLPEWSWQALRVGALCCAVPTGAVFVRLWRRTGRAPSALLVMPYAAAFLWIGLPPGLVLTTLLLAPFHALQYLAIGHRAELAIALPGRHGLAWWLNIFAGAACGGLLFSRVVPQWLDRHVHAAHGGPLLFAAAFFVFLNVHHYLIDASIWRSKGELVKALVRRPVPSDPVPDLARV